VDGRQKNVSSSTKTALYVDEQQKIPGSSTKTALNVDEVLGKGPRQIQNGRRPCIKLVEKSKFLLRRTAHAAKFEQE
jgi:hypothetical protein